MKIAASILTYNDSRVRLLWGVIQPYQNQGRRPPVREIGEKERREYNRRASPRFFSYTLSMGESETLTMALQRLLLDLVEIPDTSFCPEIGLPYLWPVMWRYLYIHTTPHVYILH